MVLSIKNLIGYKVKGTDEEIGKVTGFYFDDQTWTIRYLIVETGSFLFTRHVLVSTQSLFPTDWHKNVFLVNLTLHQVENSPAVDSNRPISGQQELEFMEHYSRFGFPSRAGVDPGSHLYSTKAKGYQVNANNNETGKLDDLLADDFSWKLNYMVVDAFAHPPAKIVLVPLSWIKEINPENETVNIDATEEKIKSIPEYFPQSPVVEAAGVG